MPITNQIAPQHMGLSTRDSCIAELIECVIGAVKRKTNSPTTAEAAAFLARLKNLANAQGMAVQLPTISEAAAFVAQLKTLGGIGAEPVCPVPSHVRILRLKQVIERIGLSRATVYATLMTDPTFPQKIQLTARTIGFYEHEIDAWVASRAQMRAEA
ncbi:helix-turn-helix transcriptional regulator [Burkholderia vietnamiensis]|uniref:helix-turn-helix transcriptional regulator n=1 Tax=Burkholderia vietnamiensis TaxID=60552 RepID=UPI000A858D59|nr:AlpA family transcriptional regulator [Burkholderia vietnamiensis]